MAERRPSFPFYPKDWLGSASVSAMPLAAQGLYVRLLAFSWLSEGLPCDEDALRRLAAVERTEWRKLWPLVAPLWECIDGRYYQRKLEALRKETADYTEARREAGRKGGQRSVEARREANGSAQPRSNPEANAEANAEAKTNPSSSIASAVTDPLPNGRVSADADVQALFDGWNQLTTPPLPRARELTADRRTQMRRRLKERPLSEWLNAVRKIEASAFCRGESDRGKWRADLDWLIANTKNIVKVVEGRYDDIIDDVEPDDPAYDLSKPYVPKLRPADW